MLIKLQEIQRFTPRIRDGLSGKIHDFYFDDELWVIRYFVMQAGAWLINRHSVLISPSAFEYLDEEQKTIYLNLTREQINKSPSVDMSKPISRQYEEQLYKHYEWSAYWATPLSGVFDRGDKIYPQVPGARDYPDERPPAGEANQSYPENSRIRSTVALKNYKIQINEETIGELKDFIVDNKNWEIIFLQMWSGAWLSNHHFLLPVHMVSDISWDNKSIGIKVIKQTIQTAPVYEPGEPITEEYATHLKHHYHLPV